MSARARPPARPAKPKVASAASARKSAKTRATARPAARKGAPVRGSREAKAEAGKGTAIERAATTHERLSFALPHPVFELDFRTPWQLLVATILSAQSTDRMVNRVTPALFARYPTPAALAAAPQEEVEALVRQTGFFRNKAKAIREASRLLVERHGGQVPADMQALVALPGVARKTANVVLGTGLGVTSGITVDTHAGRVARRLGLTRHEEPERVEDELCDLFPRPAWVETGHRLVLHGRYVCLARKPRCEVCPLNEACPSAEEPPVEPWQARAERERELVESRGGAPVS